jgi:hypothetical protein
MIRVSVTPQRLTAGEQARLVIQFTNTGDGTCRDIVFTLGLPSEVRLVDGKGRIEIAALYPGGDAKRTVTVTAVRAGDFLLISPNFSYRDEDDMPVRDEDWRQPISVDAARPPAPPPVARPAPRLRVEIRDEGAALTAGEWGLLSVLVRNPPGVPVSDVALALDGPVEARARRGRIAALPEGKAARFEFSVRPDDSGLLPVSALLTFSYPDGQGSLRQASLEVPLSIRVVRPGERPPAQPSAAPATVLFLAASPRDLVPLRPDEELRLIQQELWLGPNRDDFRLAAQVAVQLTDITRALVRYRPQIVHFTGHGDEVGRVYVEDALGRSRPTEIEGLADIFGAYSDTIQCVIVNACHSQTVAKAIFQHIDQVIGMRYKIGDNAAVRFSVGFYQAIFGGATVARAFKAAPALLKSDAETATEYEVPVLYSRNLT